MWLLHSVFNRILLLTRGNHCIMHCQPVWGEKPVGREVLWQSPCHVGNAWLARWPEQAISGSRGVAHVWVLDSFWKTWAHSSDLGCRSGLTSAGQLMGWDVGFMSCPIPHKAAGWSWWLSPELIVFCCLTDLPNVGAPFLLCDRWMEKPQGKKNGEGTSATGIIYWALVNSVVLSLAKESLWERMWSVLITCFPSLSGMPVYNFRFKHIQTPFMSAFSGSWIEAPAASKLLLQASLCCTCRGLNKSSENSQTLKAKYYWRKIKSTGTCKYPFKDTKRLT